MLALAASTSTRAPELDNAFDAGYPNSDLTIWYGVFMPSKTPREIVEKFNAAAARVLATPAMKQRLKQLAIDPMPMTPAGMDQQSSPNWARTKSSSGGRHQIEPPISNHERQADPAPTVPEESGAAGSPRRLGWRRQARR